MSPEKFMATTVAVQALLSILAEKNNISVEEFHRAVDKVEPMENKEMFERVSKMAKELID